MRKKFSSIYPKSIKFLLLFLLWGGGLHSQSPQVETISIEQGLSQGFVPTICQDDDGFLWFGTKNGLNRYDGYQFQVFKNDPFDSLSLGNNDLIRIAACGDFLLLHAQERKLQLFHRKTQRFYSIRYPNDSFLIDNLLPINKNTAALLVGGGENTALFLIHWPENLVEKIEKGEPLSRLVKFTALLRKPDMIDCDLSGDGKKIQVLTRDALLTLDIPSGNSQSMPLPASLPDMVILFDEKNIVSDVAGATWVFHNSKAVRFAGNKTDVYPLPFPGSKLMGVDRASGFFWMMSGKMLYGLDAKKIPSSSALTFQLTLDQPLVSCFADRFGNLWIGTDAHGIRKFIPRTGAFTSYMAGFSIYCQPVFNGKKHVLMGDVRREGSFPKLLDLQRGETIPLKTMKLSEQDAAHGVTTENGRFWLVPNRKPSQLICLDPEKGAIKTIRTPVTHDLEFPVLRYIAPGDIWILSINQIARYDIATGQFYFYKNPARTNSEILAAERDPNGVWWLAAANGLHKAEPDGSGGFRFSTITARQGNRNSLPTNSIKSLLIDPANPNVLWIGTNGHGMSRLDIVHNQFTHFTSKNGLPDDVVYGILADDETPRKLWISTNRGLARFSPETGQFQYFLKSDGLQENEFNTFASYKSPAGELFFGGINGLTVVNPKDLTINVVPPSVRLTSLRVNGIIVSPRDEEALLDKDIAFLERLELPFSKNSIVLQFAATDYTAPQRNQFAYYLEGAEPEWAHRGFEHSAQYLNLAPGAYTFRIKAANSSGVWNEQPISLVIVIRAPWYRTWWAYLVYVALLVGAGYFWYKNQLRRKLEQAEAARLKGLDDFKNRFFTNITHEFRTPLTVILGAARQLEPAAGGERQNAVSLIKRSGENLLRLINQILDLSKLESNTLKMNYVQGDVLPYLRYITESLHSLANVQNVMLRVESDQSKIVMDYDPERLLQIVHNLISNAIKFTPSGGRVTVQAGLLNLQGLVNLELRVTDTGAGIPPGDLPHIFDRFYQANNLEKAKAGGTGIGLALTKELVTLLGGEIRVESEVGVGTTFTITLPITQTAQVERSPSRILQEDYAPSPSYSHTVPPAQSLPLSTSLPQLLLIEDNPDVVEYLSSCLKTDFQLDFAYNGRAGIEKALETIPDLIISDVMMPEKDGFEVVETLKNDERSSHIPMVLLTAKADITSRIAGLKRGADAYLSKPFHQEELLVTINNLLELRRKLHAKYASIADVSSDQSAFRNPQPEIDLEDLFLQKIRGIVEQNLSDADFEMLQLERALAMSRSQIFRKTKALTGKSPSQFIRSIRLQHGRRLIQTTGLTVSEIAYKVGFANVKYFSDAFLEEFGVRPTELRG